ncbi:hypothetical protein ACVWWG_003780 [Bradyrhizobium sp. LB7.2]
MSLRARRASAAAIGALTLLGASPTVTSALSLTLNVRNFGARGDGSADASAAINAAIAELNRNGGTLLFPCGTYLITESLEPITASNSTIAGPENPRGCVTLKLSGDKSIEVIKVKGGNLGAKQSLFRDATSNTFTLAPGAVAAAYITPGSYILISDVGVRSNGPNSPIVATQEVVKVVAVNNDTVEIAGHFAHTFPLQPDIPNRGGSPFVQALRMPAKNVTVARLHLDASQHTGPSARALSVTNALQSTVSDIEVTGFIQKPGPTDVILFDTGYGNSLRNVRCVHCGNGAGTNGHGINMDRQSFATILNLIIKNTADQYSFGFDSNGLNWSKLSNVKIDVGGANGRPFKLLRSSYNSLDNIDVRNGGGNHNGINIADMSTNNTFTHCRSLFNTRSGIATFGNWNSYNTFIDCTSMYNTGNAFGQSRDAFGILQDHHTKIVGGTYCCNRSSAASALLQVNSDFFMLTGATIYSDGAQISAGVAVGKGQRECDIVGVRFSGLLSNREIVADAGACRIH